MWRTNFKYNKCVFLLICTITGMLLNTCVYCQLKSPDRVYDSLSKAANKKWDSGEFEFSLSIYAKLANEYLMFGPSMVTFLYRAIEKDTNYQYTEQALLLNVEYSGMNTKQLVKKYQLKTDSIVFETLFFQNAVYLNKEYNALEKARLNLNWPLIIKITQLSTNDYGYRMNANTGRYRVSKRGLIGIDMANFNVLMDILNSEGYPSTKQTGTYMGYLQGPIKHFSVLPFAQKSVSSSKFNQQFYTESFLPFYDIFFKNAIAGNVEFGFYRFIFFP